MMMRHLTVLCFVGSVSLTGCGEGGNTLNQQLDNGSTLERELPPVVLGGATTDGEVARINLDAQISGLTEVLQRMPFRADVRATLVDALLARTTYFGTYGDFETALGLATTSELQAQVLSSVHRFDEAVGLLSIEVPSEARVVETVQVARQENLEEVIETRRERANTYPSWATYTQLGAVLSAAGLYDAADEAYRQAMEVYRDVSPFAHAWVAFQRGVMWAESAGDADRALPLYREAVRRLPTYVVASVHLAELEWELGDTDIAVALLERVLPVTADPEPAGLLGEILADTDPVRAKELIALAESRYESLLSRHRLAFLDHGSEFFAGPGGDPGRAVQMATDNYDNRPTERALLLVLEASEAAGVSAESWCAYAPVSPKSVPLTEALAHHCPK